MVSSEHVSPTAEITTAQKIFNFVQLCGEGNEIVLGINIIWGVLMCVNKVANKVVQ
jgi:hypothetical protein